MTENEVTKAIAIYKKTLEATADNGETCFRELDKNTLSFLEELEQYRAIGTVEEVKSIVYIGKWGYKKGYNEAIDEFAEQMKELVYKWIDKGIIAVGCIDEIAEQLKAGEKNE